MTSDRAASRFPGHRAMLCSFVTLVMGMAAQATDEIVESDEIFKSRGKEFAVDVFAPRAAGKYPAIIALHGHGGPGEDKRSWSHDLARRLALRGYVALVPHYFGRLKPDPKNGQKNARSFSAWTRTVSDAISYAAPA